MPPAGSALAAFLAKSADFRGIGPALAARLHDEFGERLYRALSDHDQRVVEILGEDVAMAAFSVFAFKAPEADVIDWLDRRGVADIVGHAVALKIAHCWGNGAVESLGENPYLLTAFLPWRTVETVSRILGVPEDDPRRAIAAIEATLYAKLDANDTSRQ
jgi:exodeoxyribonuclease V alpha subunit